MERTTGWDGALKAILNAHGVTRGVNPAELAVEGPALCGGVTATADAFTALARRSIALIIAS